MIRVGDKVRIQLTGNLDRYKPEVAKLNGKIATVTKQKEPHTYFIDIDGGKYPWVIGELERVFDTDPETIELAEALHETLCGLNHTNGCDWHYHNRDDFTPPTKQGYYKAAQEIMKIVNKNDMITILSILKGNKII